MNAKVEKGMFLSKMKCQQVESLYALTTVPKALDKRGVVNVSSKWQVECLPVDDNDDESLEDNDESEVFTLPPPIRADSARTLGQS